MSGSPAGSDAPLQGRLIVLGITGSIAAFKAPEIVRALRAAGADVQALLTPAATRFVSPLTLRTLTGHAVDADLLDLLPDGRIGHIVAADSREDAITAETVRVVATRTTPSGQTRIVQTRHGLVMAAAGVDEVPIEVDADLVAPLAAYFRLRASRR